MRIGMDRVVASGGEPSTGNAPGFPLRARRTALAALALVAFLLPATLATSCSSSGSSGGSAHGEAKPAEPTEIRYRAVTANTSFGLVNESHTPRTELYSSRLPIDAATTKVSTDEVVAATVDYFRE